jgi:integrase
MAMSKMKFGSAGTPSRANARPRLPGANPVTRRRADGSVCLQWYASREKGAPLIAEFKGATLAEALVAEREGAADLAQAYADARERSRARIVKDFDGLILAYAGAPEFKRLAASTQTEWNRTMKALRKSPLAKLSLRALVAKGARAAFLDYRDSLAETPRKADYHMQVVSRVLNWGVDRELISRNPVAGIGALYDSDRAEIVWTNDEIDQVCAHCTPDGARAIRFMALTGLRRGDAIKAPWSAVDERKGAIIVRTGKGKRRRITQVCELTPELRALLDETPKRATTILTTAKGRPWTGDGLWTVFRRAREAAGLPAADDGKPKRLHDIRGTTATEKVAKVLADPKFQGEMGWSGRAAKTAARYVDPSNVVALNKIEENDG